MITKRPAQWCATPEFTYAVAVVLFGAIFGVALPFAAYVSGSVQAAFRVEFPHSPLLLIKVSPWGPLLFTSVGVVALVAKERLWPQRAAIRANIATIAATAIVGGLACFFLILPVVQLMRAIPR